MDSEGVVMLGNVGLHGYGGLLGPQRIGYMPTKHYGPYGLQNAPWPGQGIQNIMTSQALAQQEMAARTRIHWMRYAEEMKRARPIIAQWSEWEQQTRHETWR